METYHEPVHKYITNMAVKRNV